MRSGLPRLYQLFLLCWTAVSNVALPPQPLKTIAGNKSWAMYPPLLPIYIYMNRVDRNVWMTSSESLPLRMYLVHEEYK